MADPRQMIIEIIYDDDKGTPVLKKNTAAVEKYGKELKAFEKQLQNTTPKQHQLGKTTQATNLAMMDAGRILQDLPYGIRGVANNIDPMIQSFQRLQKQTGGSRQAFKALLGSLTGPAGIAIGVSAVTSLLVAFGPQIKDFFSNFGEGAKDVEQAKKEVELLKSAVKGGVGDFVGAFPKEEQLKAVKEALKQFDPKVNGAKDLKVDVDAITSALATFDPDALVFSQDENGNLVSQTKEEIIATLSEQHNLNDAVKEELERRLAILQADEKIAEARKRLNLNSSAISYDQTDKGKELSTTARLSLEVLPPEEIILDDGLLRDVPIEMPDLMAEFPFEKLGESGFAGARGIDSLTNALQRYGFTLQEINGMSEETGRQFLKDAMAAEQLSNVVSSGLVNAMGQGAEAIGALAAGNATPEELFGGFKLLFADFLSTFGQQLIALGIGKISLDNLFKSIGGGPAAIAAGVALVAAAGAVRSSAQNQLSNITGSGSTGNVIVGYRGAAVPSGANEQSLSFPKNVAITLNDGFGGIVARGTMELDRKGQKIYTGG